MPARDPDLATVVEGVLSQKMQTLALHSGELPEAVNLAAGDFSGAIADVLNTGRQLEADLAELHAKRSLVPEAGQRELRQAAIDDARKRADQAGRDAESAIATIRTGLLDAAMPTLDPRREALARAEAELALGDSRGEQAAGRVLEMAERGSPESQAVLMTDWGQTLLRAHEVDGRTLETARTVIAASAHRRGTTPRQLAAGAAVNRLSALGAVRAAAMDTVSQAADGRAA